MFMTGVLCTVYDAQVYLIYIVEIYERIRHGWYTKMFALPFICDLRCAVQVNYKLYISKGRYGEAIFSPDIL